MLAPRARTIVCLQVKWKLSTFCYCFLPLHWCHCILLFLASCSFYHLLIASCCCLSKYTNKRNRRDRYPVAWHRLQSPVTPIHGTPRRLPDPAEVGRGRGRQRWEWDNGGREGTSRRNESLRRKVGGGAHEQTRPPSMANAEEEEDTSCIQTIRVGGIAGPSEQ